MLQVLATTLLLTADFALFVDRERAECPDEAEMRAMIAARLGQDATTIDGSHAITVRFAAAKEPAFVAHVTVRGPAGEALGEKTLRGDDCGDLGAAVALTLSLVLHDRAPPPQTAAFAERPPVFVGDGKRAGSGPDLRARDPIVRQTSFTGGVALEGGPAFEAFTLPMAAFGAELGLALQAGWFSIAARARILRPLSYTSGAARVEGLVAGGLVEACGNVSIVSLCAVLSAAALRLSVSGLSEARETTAPWVATGARVGVRLTMSNGFTLRPHATLVIPLLRTGFVVDNTTVWSSPPVGLGVGLDVAYGWSIP